MATAPDQPQQLLEHLDRVLEEVGALPAETRVQLLDTMVTRVQARQVTALADLTNSPALAASGCKTSGSWARVYLRRGGTAHRLARRASLLPQLPGFAAAFAAGAVTDEHVDTIIRWTKPCGLEALQTHESTLLELARNASAKELDAACEALADLARPDRDADLVAALAGRSITIRGVGDLVHVDAMIEPALGEALKTAVEAGAALPPDLRPADDGRTLTQRRADAFGLISTAGISALTTSEASPAHGDTKNGGGDGGDRGAGGDGEQSLGVPAGFRSDGRRRPQVLVTVSLDRLAGIPGAPQPLLAHFGAIPTPTARRLVCDGDLARIILDPTTGLPLDVGRRRRLAQRRQRRALAAIYRHCVFPGCSVPLRFCEIHHRDWWCHGGDTDLRLLLPYCWTHHHHMHEHGFTITADAHGRLVHRRPGGRIIPDGAQPLQDTIRQVRLDIHGPGQPGPRDPRWPTPQLE